MGRETNGASQTYTSRETVTVDNRYSFANNSYDGPFCANAPVDPNLPGGGGRITSAPCANDVAITATAMARPKSIAERSTSRSGDLQSPTNKNRRLQTAAP